MFSVALLFSGLSSEWNLPYGVGGRAGSQGQAGTSHRQGPRVGVWTLWQPARPHQAEGTQAHTPMDEQMNQSVGVELQSCHQKDALCLNFIYVQYTVIIITNVVLNAHSCKKTPQTWDIWYNLASS